jgi:molybdenum cofactor cytidylyltransferase
MTTEAAVLSNALSGGAVVGLLLASGFGRRFDAGGRRNKLLARLPDGQTLVTASARALCSALEHVAVVVPARSTLLEAALSDLPVRLVRNGRAKEGMGASIAVGISALRQEFPHARGWLIALGDMPFIAPRTMRLIADSIGHRGHRIVAACHRGSRGHPVAFDCSLTDELLALGGDQGASALLQAHGVALVDTDDPGVLRDVDTKDDLARIVESAPEST